MPTFYLKSSGAGFVEAETLEQAIDLFRRDMRCYSSVNVVGQVGKDIDSLGYPLEQEKAIVPDTALTK